MKRFFSLYHLKDQKILFGLESIIILSTLMLTINTNLNWFNINALIISLSIWLLSSLLDSKRYFNFFTLLSTGIFGYGVFWFLFEILWRSQIGE